MPTRARFAVRGLVHRAAAGCRRGRAFRERRARSAAEQLAEGGTPVRFDRSIYVPEDEICFFVFDVPSGRDAPLAAQRAELDPLRVVEAVSSREEELRSKRSRTTTNDEGRGTT